jgi:hypothetical protein
MARKKKNPTYVPAGSNKKPSTPVPVEECVPVLRYFAVPCSDEDNLIVQPTWQLGTSPQDCELLLLRVGARARGLRWGCLPRCIWIASFPPLSDKSTMHELFAQYCESSSVPAFYPRTWTLGARAELTPEHSTHVHGSVIHFPLFF